jgi:hypothetical protein
LKDGSAFAENVNAGDCNTLDITGRLWMDVEFAVRCYVFPGPGDLQLRFVHKYGTETLVDGGNIKMKINDSAFTPVDGSAFSENSCSETLATQNEGNSNPLSGEAVKSDLSLTRAHMNGLFEWC